MIPTTPTQHAICLAGRQIETRMFVPEATASVAAVAAAPRIVLLHEGLGCIALWRQFPQALADLLREPVLAYSRYGYGQSEALSAPRTAQFMHEEAERALPELLRAFGIGRAILVGHSDGASIALLHAALHPAQTRAVVALAPHLFVEDFGIASIAQARSEFDRPDMQQRLARYHRDPQRTFLGEAMDMYDRALKLDPTNKELAEYLQQERTAPEPDQP